MSTTIKEAVTTFTKRVSYNMQEGTIIGRQHLGLSEDYTCGGLDLIEKDGVEYVRMSLYHADSSVDPEEYNVDVPVEIEVTIPTGQYAFEI